MAGESVAIRLGLEGGRDVSEGLKKMGADAEASFKRITDVAQASQARLKAFADQAKNTAEQIKGLYSSAQSRIGTAMPLLQQGAGMGLGGLAQGIISAGGLRNFAALSGGPAAAGLIAAGAGAAYSAELASLQEMANKAGVAASAILALQEALKTFGLDGKAAEQVVGAFAERMGDLGGKGATLRDTLKELGISMTDANGNARSSVTIFGDLMNRIRETTDEKEKLRIATAAVGEELSTKLVAAANEAKTSLTDLESQSRSLAGVFADTLGPAAAAGAQALRTMKAEADQLALSLKAVFGQASLAEKFRLRQMELKGAQTRQNLGEPQFDAMGNFIGYGPASPGAAGATDEATRQAIAAGARAALAGQLPQSAPMDVSRFGANTPFGVAAPVTPPETPGGSGGGGAANTEETDKAAEAYKRLNAELERLRENLTMTDKEKFIAAQVTKLGTDATQEQKDAVAALAAAYWDQKTAIEASAKAAQELSQDVKTVGQALVQGAIQGRDFNKVLLNILSSLATRGLSRLLDGALGGLGGLFGSGSSVATGAPLNLLPRAGGGDFDANRWLLVGERGPEIANFGRGGSVINNDRLRTAMGGGVQVTTKNYAPGVDVEPRLTPQGVEIMINRAVAASESRIQATISDQRMRAI